MSEDVRMNELGQPVGDPLPGWVGRPRPPREAMQGLWCSIEPLDPDAHAADLFAANGLDPEGRSWTYLPYGPFADLAAYRAWLEPLASRDDPLFHTVTEQEKGRGRALGLASYLRIEPAVGVIEVGHIHLSPRLQRRPAATEAMFLMMRRAFDELGYRRYEWKCDALNAPSRAAALRLGFRFEGVFRQATMYKGRNRDTAWFSIIDREWPALKATLERWLDPANFDADGKQKSRLSELTAALGSGRSEPA
jgi:RimJ/RimL family protein N-acetyltransferase